MTARRQALAVVLVAIAAQPASAERHGLDCGNELRHQNARFQHRLRVEIDRTGTHYDTAKKRKLTAWLSEIDRDIVEHERAHRKAAGRWAGRIKYIYYDFEGRKYAAAGCHQPKDGIPLAVSLKSLLAPAEPSSWDLENAERMKRLIKVKKARRKCLAIKAYASKNKCLKPYAGYRWLDRYPLTAKDAK